MVYEVKRSPVEKKRFEFTIDGETYSVPLVKHLTVEQIEKLEESGLSVRGIMVLFGETAAAVRTLDQEEFLGLSKAWAEESGVSLGELLGSAA